MTISMSASLKAAFSQRSFEPRFVLNIYTATGTSVSFMSGTSDNVTQAAYPISVMSVSSVSREIDIVENKTQVSQCEVVLRLDPAVRSLIVNNGVAGSRAELLIGEKTVAVANYCYYFVGIIANIEIDQPYATLIVKTPEANLRAATSSLMFLDAAVPPLTTIKSAAEHVCGAVTSGMTPNTYTTTSHFVVSPDVTMESLNSSEAGGVLSEIIDEMLLLTGGHVITQENGTLYYVPYDETTAASVTWTEDDISDFEMVELYGNIINRVTVYSHKFDDIYKTKVAVEDTSAQSRFAQNWVSSSPSLVRAKEYKIKYNNAFCNLAVGTALTPSAPAANGTLAVTGGGFSGFCGTYWSGFPSGSQNSANQISTTNLAYIAVGGCQTATEMEIIACKALAVSTAEVMRPSLYDPTAGASPYQARLVPVTGTYTVSARAQLGTTAIPQGNVRVNLKGGNQVGFANEEVRDVTMEVALANRIVRRFKDGCPIVRVKTTLKYFDVQVGDHVSVVTNRFVWYGHDGADTSITWQVIGKTCEVDGDSPGVTFTLAYSNQTSVPTVTKSYKNRLSQKTGLKQMGFRNTLFQNGSQRYVAGGFDATYAIGAAAFTVADGFSADTNIAVAGKSISPTLTASKDTYFSHTLSSGAITTREVSVGATAPTQSTDEVSLWMVTTNSSALITVVTDQRVYVPITNDVVTVGPASISANTVGAHHRNLRDACSGLVPNGEMLQKSRAVATYPVDNFACVRSDGAGNYSDDTTLWGTSRDVYVETSSVFRTGDQSVRIDPKETAFVQAQTFGYSTHATLVQTVPMTLTTTDGNTLILISEGDQRITSITQQGCVWTRAVQKIKNSVTVEVWYAPNISAAGSTITINYSTNADSGDTYILAEFSGTLRVSPVDVSASSSGTGTSMTTTSATTTRYGDLLIGAFGSSLYSLNFSSPAAGWTLQTVNETTTPTNHKDTAVAMMYKIATAAGAETATLSIDNSEDWAGIIVAFFRVTDPGVRTEDATPVTEGDVYEGEFDLRISNVATTVLARIQWLQGDGSTVISNTDFTGTLSVGANVWMRKRLVAVAPTNARWARLYVTQDEDTAGITYIDRLKLRRVGYTFRAYRNSTGVTAPTATATQIAFNAESHDYGGGYDTDEFVVPYSGDYDFEANAQLGSLADTKLAYLALYVNGVEKKRGGTIINGTGGTSDVSCAVTAGSIYLTVGDTVDVRLYHNHGSDLTISAGEALTSFAGRGKL